MKAIRLLALLLAGAAAAFAQVIFDRTTLDGAFPAWLLVIFPRLSGMARWPADSLRTLAVALSTAAALTFGLVVPAWTGGDEPHSLDAPARRAQPERSWPWMLPIALLALLLSSWDRGALPGVIPAPAAAAADQAALVADGSGPGWLRQGGAQVTGLATLPAALITRMAGDPLRGGASAGALAAALLVAGVWLLGCELFRRTPDCQDATAPGAGWLQDDGRLPALLAAFALAGSAPLLHLGRFAGQVEPVAVGVFGLWATLRGARTGRRGLIALGGALAALAAGMAPGALALAAAAALLWPGIWLLRPSWFDPRLGRGGLSAVAVWLAAAVLVALPFLAAFERAPAPAPAPPVDAGFLAYLGRTLLGFNSLPDAGGWAPFPLHMLSNWLAPFFVLALGALLFSFDSLPGWALITWLAAGIAAAAARPAAPAWDALLPALPAAALAVAFALDRIRAALAEGAGAWAARAASVFAVGVVGLALLTTWANYGWAAAPGDTASAIMRAALAAPEGAPTLLVVSRAEETPTWDDPRLLHFAAQDATPAGSMVLDAGAPGGWPDELPAGSRVLVPPQMQAAIAQLDTRYGRGTLETVRDRRANILLYVWAPA